MCHLHNSLKHSTKAFSNHFLQRQKTEGQLEREFLNISVVQAQSSLCIEMKVNTKLLEQLIKTALSQMSATTNCKLRIDTVILRMVSDTVTNMNTGGRC